MKTVKRYWQLWLLTVLCLLLVIIPASKVKAALVLGTNSGFVTSAPTEDPAGTSSQIDNYAKATKHTAPAGATQITDVLWYCDNDSNEADFEVGLYSHDAVNDVPLTRLYVDTVNAKGTTAGWKSVDVSAANWTITAGTIYWIAVQLDDTATTTNGNRGAGASVVSRMTGEIQLVTPWAEDIHTDGYMYAICAVYETAGSSETNLVKKTIAFHGKNGGKQQ